MLYTQAAERDMPEMLTGSEVISIVPGSDGALGVDRSIVHEDDRRYPPSSPLRSTVRTYVPCTYYRSGVSGRSWLAEQSKLLHE